MTTVTGLDRHPDRQQRNDSNLQSITGPQIIEDDVVDFDIDERKLRVLVVALDDVVLAFLIDDRAETDAYGSLSTIGLRPDAALFVDPQNGLADGYAE